MKASLLRFFQVRCSCIKKHAKIVGFRKKMGRFVSFSTWARYLTNGGLLNGCCYVAPHAMHWGTDVDLEESFNIVATYPVICWFYIYIYTPILNWSPAEQHRPPSLPHPFGRRAPTSNIPAIDCTAGPNERRCVCFKPI